MNGFDGPTLRSVRESAGVPLRRVARQASMSHGHLSKVERGEPGRPVTPAVLAAYEKATGIKLTGVAGHGPADPHNGGWRRGHLSDARRRTLNAKIAAVAVGGPLVDQLQRILDATGRPTIPDGIEDADAIQIEHVAALCTSIDLRYGGAVADQMARALLRWAIGLLEASDRTASGTGARLHAAVAALAQRAGWAAFDADSHDIARSLLTVALFAATRADDADLRAHVIADFAAQHNYLGYPEDCLQVVRFAEVDERVGPHVQMVLHGIKARAYAVRGEVDACARHIQLAEDAQVQAAAQPVGGWLDRIATDAHLYAATGHATATLARRTGSPTARNDAQQRLGQAVEQLDPVAQARPAALCTAQLATLHLEAGELDQGVHWGRRVLDTARSIRSHRLSEHLAMVKAAAERDTNELTVKQLLTDLEEALQ